MKLNADIIYKHLAQKYNVLSGGPGTSTLSLNRPEFFMGDSPVFRSDHLYLATVEHLPRRPVIEKNAVLVCIGENVSLKYYREHLRLITIRNKADFFRVYHDIQDIFEKYDEWERSMYIDLTEDADMQKIIQDSSDIFGKPIVVLDHSFRIAAAVPETMDMPGWTSSKGEPLQSESIEKFLGESVLLTEKKGALQLDINNYRTLCVNLFNDEDVYEGCLCISMGDQKFNEGENRLAEFLAAILDKAIRRQPRILNDESTSVKALMQTLVEELPISPTQRWLLNAVNHKETYVCVDMHWLDDRSRQIPAGYICDIFEETFADSWAFRKENSIVGFIRRTDEDYEEKLVTFLRQMELRAGVSDPFADLFDIRIHYAQAVSAVENGRLLEEENTLYKFSDYALTEMIINSLGGLPAEAYFPEGFRRLVSHDMNSGVSYMETLKVFLQENMSYTSAAEKLFVHRSTLIDRIARIERDLGIDLKDPSGRLLLEMLLKALEIEKKLKQR